MTRRYNLDSLLDDFFEVQRLVKEDANGYKTNVEFTMEGKTIVIPDYDEDSVYKVMYTPKVARITSSTSNSLDLKSIGVQDSVAALIPYFVKGDLFMHDEPRLASEARNWYEQSVAEMKANLETNYTSVQTHYGVD